MAQELKLEQHSIINIFFYKRVARNVRRKHFLRENGKERDQEEDLDVGRKVIL
jgi:hypothetical protein